MNEEWHEAHPMPKKPTLAQRMEWHLEHARHCKCRPIPPKLLAQINSRNAQPAD